MKGVKCFFRNFAKILGIILKTGENEYKYIDLLA